MTTPVRRVGEATAALCRAVAELPEAELVAFVEPLFALVSAVQAAAACAGDAETMVHTIDAFQAVSDALAAHGLRASGAMN